MAHSLRFVTAPTAAATTILDLDNANPWTLQDGSSFDPPTLTYSTISNAMSDGAAVSAASYGNRTVHLVLRPVNTGNRDTWATAVQNLARVLQKDRAWLRLQLTDASAPVFFHTFRAAPSAINELFAAGQLADLTLDLPADPAAYGLGVTIAPTGLNYYEINRLTLPTIQGDMETPLLVHLSDSAGAVLAKKNPLIASVSLDGYTMPTTAYQQDVAGYTLNTDTTYVAGAGMRTTFATTTAMSRRFFGYCAPMIGQYRVFVRIKLSASSTTSTFQLKYGQSVSGGPVYGDVTTWTGNYAAQWTWVDLGLFQEPYGSVLGQVGMVDHEQGQSTYSPVAEFAAARTAGTGGIDVDSLAFIPFDVANGKCRLAIAEIDDNQADGTRAVLDGISQQFRMMSPNPTDTTNPEKFRDVDQLPPFSTGGYPVAVPGWNNYLLFCRSVGHVTRQRADGSWFGTPVTNVGVYYVPRYLYVRPATT